MVCLNHRLNPSTPSPLPGACVPATAGTHAELLVYIYIPTCIIPSSSAPSLPCVADAAIVTAVRWLDSTANCYRREGRCCISPPPGVVFQARLLDNQEGANSANAEQYVFGKLSARCSQRRLFRYRHYSNHGTYQPWEIGPGVCDIHQPSYTGSGKSPTSY